MSLIRNFLNSTPGKLTVVLVAVLALGWVIVRSYSLFSPSSAGYDSSYVMYICTETKKPFRAKVVLGRAGPVPSPHSGKDTGVIAELCFYNPDGTLREPPTPVLLNTYLGDSTPTFCPDCNRLVTARNSGYDPERPPPTREQYEARKANRQTSQAHEAER